eukprot:6108223-Prymnesium_polylepis.1
MMRDLGGGNIHHPYTGHIHAFGARKSRYSSSYSRLHGASEAQPPPCAAASAMHHGAASAD